MSSGSDKFLQIVLGQDGAKALAKATERAPILSSVLVPRTIVSWLETAVRLQYEGEIPGLDNSYISLHKTEANTFTGALTVDENVHSFNGADLVHVAAAISVSLGISGQGVDPQLKGQDLSRLGKSIDLLVKARVVSEALRDQELAKATVFDHLPKKEECAKVELPGKNAAPRGPEAPTPPEGQAKQPANTAKPTFGKKEIKISKSESERRCFECGGQQFSGDKLVGCLCFRGLLKASKVQTVAGTDGSFTVKFVGYDWDADTMQALISVFKG